MRFPDGWAMTHEDIIRAFTAWTEVPTEAIAAASAGREELIPVFIETIERFIESDNRAAEAVGSPLYVIVPLLAEWKAHAAYRPVCRLLGCDEEIFDDVCDYALLTLPRIVASLYDGDPQPILDLIRNADASEMAREEMFKTLAILVAEERLDRSFVVRLLRDTHRYLSDLDTHPWSMLWSGWRIVIRLLGIEELAPLVRDHIRSRKYQNEKSEIGLFEQAMALARARPNYPWKDESIDLGPLKPTAALLDFYGPTPGSLRRAGIPDPRNRRG